MADLHDQTADATRASDSSASTWRWTLGSGVLTILLALIAFWLPEIDWLPRASLVGWLLLVAGVAELALGSRRGSDSVARAALWSGAITSAAGLLFVLRPSSAYFPVANVILLWLLVRGASVLAIAAWTENRRSGLWLGLGGLVDLILAALMIAGLPLTGLVVAMFGPTPEVVARFALFLAASFAATGVSQIAIALIQRDRAPLTRQASSTG